MSDKIKVYFLGTSASTPTKTRNLSSLLINYKGSSYLFDSPENVQQQVLRTGQSIMKIKHIFITHFHGDHYYGLLGLLSSMSLSKREDSLTIYIPNGYLSFLNNFLKYSKVNLTFNLEIKEVKPNNVFSFDNLTVSSVKLDHTIPSFGYVFKIKDKIGKFNKKKALTLKIPEGPLFSKLQAGKSIKVDGKTIKPDQVIDFSYKQIGKKIAYLTDTAILKKPSKLLHSSDLLIHECTFLDTEKEKAKDKKHSYFSGVVDFFKKTDSKKLYLIHISSRYKDMDSSLKKLRNKNVVLPNDLDFLEVNDY